MTELKEKEVLNLFKNYWNSIPKEIKNTILQKCINIGTKRPGISPFESFLLYFYILENKPNFVFEMGTRDGTITYAIASALKQLNKKNIFVTTEIQNIHTTKKIFNNIGLGDFVEFIQGNGIEIAKKYNIDFCIIDADHSYTFAKKYINELFPVLTKNCFVFIHDHLCYVPGNLEQDIKNTPPKHEQRATKEYLLSSKSNYFLTHELVRGRHLPFNNNFANKLKSIINVDLFPGGKMMPTSLIFNKR